jgi:nitroreductase
MVDWKELTELVKTRRSIRRFQDKPVPEDILVKALELATWAPNSGNQQSWRFWIVTNKELIQKMGDAVKAKTELMASWPEAKQFGETVARWKKTSDFFRGAPACIVVLMGRYSSIADQILHARGETDPVAREIHSFRFLPADGGRGQRLPLPLPALFRAGHHLDGRSDSGQERDRRAFESAAGVGFRGRDSGGIPGGDA